MEMEILTEEEALEKPAGKAREEPNQNPLLIAPKYGINFDLNPIY